MRRLLGGREGGEFCCRHQDRRNVNQGICVTSRSGRLSDMVNSCDMGCDMVFH